MSDRPLVSVIIPFYNAPTLKNAIESILDQTYQHFELILIDNASADNSLKTAIQYTSDSRVTVSSETKRGVAFAMNKGISLSTGSFIMRMDADDYAYPTRIEKQLEAFSSDPELQVVSGLVAYEGDEENEGFRLYIDWLNSIRSPEEIVKNQFVEFPLANPSLMFRNEVFEKYGIYEDGPFPEDYEFFLRLQSKNVKMGKAEDYVIRWVDSDARLTRTDSRYSQDAFFKLKAKYLSQWLRENNPFDPEVMIWGAGRLSRKRSNYLLEHGFKIKGYVDVVKKPDVIHYLAIEKAGSYFIVSYVSNRNARNEIKAYLLSKGYKEGIHFILAA